MTSKVAIIEFDKDTIKESLKQALDFVGGITDLNTTEKPVIIKVGVFSHRAENHASVSVVDAIVNLFDKAPKIRLAESDNYQGSGLERLQLWKELFTERVAPVNLSDDPEPVRVKLADQKVNMPRILLEPRVLVDTHILRSFERGSVLKNLFGCILDSKRAKYHKILPTLLADVYEAIGGVDFAVLDGTYFWRGAGTDPVPMNTLVMGRDAVAVETVGAVIAGLDPQKMPVIQEFVKRGLGEGVLENIEIVGASLETLRDRFMSAVRIQKKQSAKLKGPQTWGGQAHKAFEGLIHEGFFKQPKKRTLEEVIGALEKRGLSTQSKERKVADSLARRVNRGVLKKSKTSDGHVYWTERPTCERD
ncbi:MAG: DUF362 domain-containing protein [Candidatus Bathyarchaeia archaeon]